jgi:FG-GAP-like repeat
MSGYGRSRIVLGAVVVVAGATAAPGSGHAAVSDSAARSGTCRAERAVPGGSSHPPIPVKCCVRVSTRPQLVAALALGPRCVFVENNAQIDLAAVNDQRDPHPYWVLHVPDGLTLESGRSPTVEGGLLYMSRRIKQEIMLDVGSNTRITGLRLRGYNPSDTTYRRDGTQAIMVDGQPGSGHLAVRNDLIDNNEIYGWPTAGVNVIFAPPGDQSIRITGNYIHNNVQCNTGYGVLVAGSGAPRIDRNVFDFDRHDVSSDGRFGTGYLAEQNFVLTAGPTCGGLYNQHFDVHGTGPNGYGGPAGQDYTIRNNTIRGDQNAFAGFGVRPAFELRGIPAKATFANNAVVHDDEDNAITVEGANEDQLRMNGELVSYGNRYKVWTAKELAVGHFDGDRCSDVFQATGAVWVYSPCGRGIWRFLNQSPLGLDRLAFGDFNGDGRTDVFSQSGDQWRVSYSATGPWTLLPAGSSIPMKEYRFGDFDGDGKTDVFRASGSRFFYSSAGATGWRPLAFSHMTIDQLRFGEFKQPGRTDVFSLANGHWSVSYGGATRWQPLNLQLSSDLGALAFADLDGNGRTDIARCHDGTAEVSWSAITHWWPLQFACDDGFPGLLFGNFTGSARADVLGAGSDATVNRYQLSRAGRTSFFQWSLQDML